ncbi:MAG: cation-translocating P-type ATPase [Deltaproteobacteria bacterium]|nr:cation-translocating P-type ATPase [Deltaproteobacteria bacterium]MBW2150947.1 cation-translocating P-type ATPase [Deltaproteobacteria bacterium]
MTVPDACDLCGLSVRYRQVRMETTDNTFKFCCNGCRQVFQMLASACGTYDPARFRETELFKKCQQLGIIPCSENDLKVQAQIHLPYPSAVVTGTASSQKQSDPQGDALDLILRIDGMWCPACAWVIEASLKKLPGVVHTSCNFSTDRLQCRYDPIRTSSGKITEIIEGLGYRAFAPEQPDETAEKKRELIRFTISASFTMNIMMFSFALYSGFFTSLSDKTIGKLAWPAFAMTTIVLFYGGKSIFQKAARGVVFPALGMETLIAAGSLCAYLYSIYRLFQGSAHVYFDTASMLITLTLLGKMLDSRAKDRVQSQLGNFFALMPRKVKICTEKYPEGRYVSIDHLKQNDTFLVEQGETVAADGMILSGRGTVDESSLTGEATPVKKNPGDRIKSGVTVLHGWFRVEAQGVGEASLLGQMIRIIDKALAEQTELEEKTDRILQWFVPGIFVVASATGVVWLLLTRSAEIGMLRAVTVLVISCPCALAIAIPLTRAAGISIAGKQGILVRNFSAFERVENVNAVVFDKTGTMTKGNWALQEIIPLTPFQRNEVLSAAACLEQHSDHYISTEIRRYAEKQGVVIPVMKRIEKVVVHDNGISGQLNHQTIKIGSRDFLASEITSADLSGITLLEAETSLVFMSLGGRLCAVFVFGDQLRENAAKTVAYLRSRGFFTALVSGDGKRITQKIGERIGVHQALGGQLPKEKADFIKHLQQKSHRVVMVGDGINDAAALAQAELAVAVYCRSHLDNEVADLTLIRSDPYQMIDFLHLAKQVNRKVQQNLICAVIYNLISIPVAVSGFLTPLIAVSAMFMSSLTVIGNTLWLIKRFTP